MSTFICTGYRPHYWWKKTFWIKFCLSQKAGIWKGTCSFLYYIFFLNIHTVLVMPNDSGIKRSPNCLRMCVLCKCYYLFVFVFLPCVRRGDWLNKDTIKMMNDLSEEEKKLDELIESCTRAIHGICVDEQTSRYPLKKKKSTSHIDQRACMHAYFGAGLHCQDCGIPRIPWQCSSRMPMWLMRIFKAFPSWGSKLCLWSKAPKTQSWTWRTQKKYVLSPRVGEGIPFLTLEP